METNCKHRPQCVPGEFGRCCRVYGMWGDRVRYDGVATGKADAWQQARKLLVQGYAVSFSNALLFVMGRGDGEGPASDTGG